VGHGDVLGVQRKGNALLLRVNWTHYSGSTRSRGSRVRSSRSSAKTATRSTMARAHGGAPHVVSTELIVGAVAPVLSKPNQTAIKAPAGTSAASVQVIDVPLAGARERG